MISPLEDNNEFIGLVPRLLLRAFIHICLDNAEDAYSIDTSDKPIEVRLSKEEGKVKFSIIDEGIPFNPPDDISNRPLGQIAQDLKHFGIPLQMPMKNETRKVFTISIPLSALDIRINHKGGHNAAT